MPPIKTTEIAGSASTSGALVIVNERGFGNFFVDRFETEAQALKYAKAYWSCWCLFRQSTDGELEELASGGVGVAHPSIRRHAHSALNPNAVVFNNRPNQPKVDDSIKVERRVVLGVVFPAELHLRAIFMTFDKERPVEKLVAAACSHAGVNLDKGRLPGSPERLNLFTIEGDVVVLEKGNRLAPCRLRAVQRSLQGLYR